MSVSVVAAAHFIHRHKQQMYTYNLPCMVCPNLVSNLVRKSQFAVLLAIIFVLFSQHKLCSYTKELLGLSNLQIPPITLASTRKWVGSPSVFSGTVCRYILSLPMQQVETHPVTYILLTPRKNIDQPYKARHLCL